MDILNGTTRHCQAIFMFKILPLPRRVFDCLFHEGGVFGMNPLENKFHSRYRGAVVLEDAKGFF